MKENEKVAVAFLHPGTVAGVFAASLAATMRQVPNCVSLMAKQTGPRIASARNQVTDEFLDTEYDWLLWVDSDMKFEPQATARVLEAADAEERPVVGGLCFASQQDLLYPTMYQYAPDGEHFLSIITYPRDELVPVDGTGAAFVVVHRSVFETVREHAGDEVYPWYREDVVNGKERGEDLTFCHRARQAGIPIHVHTGARIGHMKDRVVDEKAYAAQLAKPPTVLTGPPGLPEEWLSRLFNAMRVPTGTRQLFPASTLAGESPGTSPFRMEVSWPAAPSAQDAMAAGCPVIYFECPPEWALADESLFTCSEEDEDGRMVARALGEEWGEIAPDDPEREVRAGLAYEVFNSTEQADRFPLMDLADPETDLLYRMLDALGHTRDRGHVRAALEQLGPPSW